MKSIIFSMYREKFCVEKEKATDAEVYLKQQVSEFEDEFYPLLSEKQKLMLKDYKNRLVDYEDEIAENNLIKAINYGVIIGMEIGQAAQKNARED